MRYFDEICITLTGELFDYGDDSVCDHPTSACNASWSLLTALARRSLTVSALAEPKLLSADALQQTVEGRPNVLRVRSRTGWGV